MPGLKPNKKSLKLDYDTAHGDVCVHFHLHIEDKS